MSFSPDPNLFPLYDASIRFSDDEDMSVLTGNEDDRKRNYILGLTGTSVLIIVVFASWGLFIQCCKKKIGKRYMTKCFCTSRKAYSSQNISPDGNSTETFTLVRNNEFIICGNLDDKNFFDSLLRRMRCLRTFYLLVAFSLMAFTIILLLNIIKLDHLIYTTSMTIDKMNSPASILQGINLKMKVDVDKYNILRENFFYNLRSSEMTTCLNNVVLQNSAGAMEIHLRDLNLDSNQEYMERFVSILQAGKVLVKKLSDDLFSGYDKFFWTLVSCVIMVNTMTVFCIYLTMKALKRFPQNAHKCSNVFKQTTLFLFITFTGLLWCFACGFHIAVVVNGDFCFSGKANVASSNTTQNRIYSSADDNVLNILRVNNIDDGHDLSKIVRNIISGCPVSTDVNHQSNPDTFMKPIQDKLDIALVANSIFYSSIQSSRVHCPSLFSSLSDQMLKLEEILENLSRQYSNARNTYSCEELHGYYIEVTQNKVCNAVPGALAGNFVSILMVGFCAMCMITLRITWETDIEIFLRDIDELDDDNDNTNDNSLISVPVDRSLDDAEEREDMDELDSYSISNSSSEKYSQSFLDNTSSLDNTDCDDSPAMKREIYQERIGANPYISPTGTSRRWR